ncbi:MAG: hypothetical protein ACMZI0_03655 [Symbiopectobacterium sp.]|uniref:hypothetical protein n=1 Tax=Symbiopectobacterium sp. TaxID=2952789 RepID=UPI0039E7E272
MRSDSPITGSSLKGFDALNSFDSRIDKISNEVISKGLDCNKEIHIMVTKKIELVQDGNLREFLHQEWRSGPFRESIRVFETMDNIIKKTNGFHRADALFSHQPINLDLFKDYLKQGGTQE